VWLYALTRPSEATYNILVNDPAAKPTRGLLWVGLTSLFISLAVLVFRVIFGPNMDQMVNLLQRDAGAAARPVSILILLVCGIPAGAIVAVLGTVIYTALVNFTAGALGGTGNFNQLVYLFSAITAPLSLVSTLLGLVPILGCLGIPLAMYSVYLEILAVKTVHRLDWVRSAGSVLILVVLGLLIVAVCVVAIFVPLFTTMMRNSF
jgi:hypothetical protein